MAYPKFAATFKSFADSLDDIIAFEQQDAQHRKGLIQQIKSGEADDSVVKELSEMAEDRLACLRAVNSMTKRLESFTATFEKWQQQAHKDRELVLRGMSAGDAAAKRLARQVEDAEHHMKEVRTGLLVALGQFDTITKNLHADGRGRHLYPHFLKIQREIELLAKRLSQYFISGGQTSARLEVLVSLLTND